MQFVLTFNQPIEEIERHEDPALAAQALAPWKSYMDDMAAAGVMRGGNRLAAPWTATTVRWRGGQRLIQDGPFADTKELAAGYVVIEVSSFDEALRWAERSPSSSTGSTEIRPVAATPT
ncbi:YciI family protein [Hydrogenophaga sp.]|uniref:YciI family protein n=1 Tax=Hydrogenophaga sp. TaxID=1904254 RepID=UPI003AF484B1